MICKEVCGSLEIGTRGTVNWWRINSCITGNALIEAHCVRAIKKMRQNREKLTLKETLNVRVEDHWSLFNILFIVFYKYTAVYKWYKCHNCPMRMNVANKTKCQSCWIFILVEPGYQSYETWRQTIKRKILRCFWNLCAEMVVVLK
jgi:hypothetical protein